MTHETGNARLLQLAEHLESDRRLLQRFDFQHICHLDPIEKPLGDRSTVVDLSDNTHQCGTSGCAMGEMPKLWPNEWAFTSGSCSASVRADQLADPAALANLRSQCSTLLVRRIRDTGRYNNVDDDLQAWFEIDEDAFTVLFHPATTWDDTQLELSDGSVVLKPLPGHATASDVAQHIRRFVSSREKGHA